MTRIGACLSTCYFKLNSWAEAHKNFTFAASLISLYILRNSGWSGCAICFLCAQGKVARLDNKLKQFLVAKTHALAKIIFPEPVICKITGNEIKDRSKIFRVALNGTLLPSYDTFDIYAFFLGALFQKDPQLINPCNRQPLAENEIQTLCDFFKMTKEQFEAIWPTAIQAKYIVDGGDPDDVLSLLMEDENENNQLLANWRYLKFLMDKPEFSQTLKQYLPEPFEEPQLNNVVGA